MFDSFLNLESVPGDSVVHGFEGQIELAAWSWGQESEALTGPSSEDGLRAHARSLVFSKKVDKATPKLMLASLSRQVLPKAVLTCRAPGGRPYDLLKVIMLDVRVSAYRIASGVTSSERPIEEVGIAFARILFEWTEMRPDGSFAGIVRCGWDMESGESF